MSEYSVEEVWAMQQLSVLLTTPPAQPAERMVEGMASEWMRTHAENARKAMLIAVDHAEVLYPDIDDKSYWWHEINALDKAMLTAAQQADR